MRIRDLGILVRGLYLTFTRRRVTLGRTAYVLLASSLYLFLRVTVRVGHWLDDLFQRGYRSQAVHAPVYVITFPRSGTTFLHRLLCLDEEQFTYHKTYQTLLPAVSLYKLVGFLIALDRRLHRLVPRAVQWLNRKAFAKWDNIHPIGLNRAEEDEGIFLYPLWTPVIYLLFPFIDEFRDLQFIDDAPQELRRRVMDFYRRCLQCHLYTDAAETGHERTLLSKNVHSVGRIASILETFPDARFIFVVRDPYRAVPSLLSLYYAVWEVHSPDIPKRSPETLGLARMGYDFYRYLKEMCEKLPEEQYTCVGFEELVQDPVKVVEYIYRHFGLPLSEAFRTRLEQSTRDSNGYRSVHRYSLEEYGLSEQEVYRALEDVFEFARQKRAVVHDSTLLEA
jgi:hypothetical protein